jgi:cytochrome c oxidase accessory protein FixG
MDAAIDKKEDSFRDHISTIGKDGRRAWIFAQQPKGPLYNARTLVSLLLLLVFFTLPFIQINGDPLFMLNIVKGKFILAGVVFWSQDFILFGLGMLIFILFIVLFTVVFGRLFCGWVCPQTIFMELIFRRIEFWIEGDAVYQRALNKGPWTIEKIIKKSLKHFLFFLIAFLIANTFLLYMIGKEDYIGILQEPLNKNAGGFFSLFAFTGVFYFVFAWFREQVCLVVCPYGRLQGVLLDKNSILVAYDYIRGENRHKFKKNEKRAGGDCIDCDQCVKVCPTGIDIRNGTQLECVNCTACIDACNHMMKSVGLPEGLIRYDSEKGIAEKQKLGITPRIIAYSCVLLALIGLESFLMVSRTDLDVSVIRARGLLYQECPDSSQVSNIYNIKLENKTRTSMPVELKLESGEGRIEQIGHDFMILPKESHSQGEFYIYFNKKAIHSRKTKLKIGIYSGTKKIRTIETSFFGPVSEKP